METLYMLSKKISISAIALALAASGGYGSEDKTEKEHIFPMISQASNLKAIFKEIEQDKLYERAQKQFFNVSPMEYLGGCPRGVDYALGIKEKEYYPYKYNIRPTHVEHPTTQEQIPLNAYFMYPDGLEDIGRTAEEVYQDALDIQNNHKEERLFSEKAKDLMLHNLAFAAQMGHAQAQVDFAVRIYLYPNTVGTCYSFMGLGRDEETFPIAYYFLKLAAEQGQRDALCCLGQIFYKNQNYKNAFELFSAAAQQQVPEAYYMLGELYRIGNHVPMDITLATSYREISKNMGFEL